MFIKWIFLLIAITLIGCNQIDNESKFIGTWERDIKHDNGSNTKLVLILKKNNLLIYKVSVLNGEFYGDWKSLSTNEILLRYKFLNQDVAQKFKTNSGDVGYLQKSVYDGDVEVFVKVDN